MVHLAYLLIGNGNPDSQDPDEMIERPYVRKTRPRHRYDPEDSDVRRSRRSELLEIGTRLHNCLRARTSTQD